MAELPVTSYGRKVVGEKSRLVSLFLSFTFPGLGIIYAGALKKGLAFFISYLVLFIAIIVSYCVMIFSSLGSVAALEVEEITTEMAMSGMAGILITSGIICIAGLAILILMIVSMILGYGMCKENNQLWIEYLENN